MNTKIKPKAPWGHRFAIKVCSILLAILIFWILGFLVHDIDSIDGPQFSTYESNHLDKSLVSQEVNLSKKISDLQSKILDLEANQSIIKNSTENLQKTIGQILDIQKLDIAKNSSRTKEESKAFSDSLNLFLNNQKKFQSINLEISTYTAEKQILENERNVVSLKLSNQRDLARHDYNEAQHSHELKIAIFKLGVLVPFLILSLFFTHRYRKSPLLPLLLSFSIPIILKVSLVIHEHFPSKIFKYVLILLLIGSTIKLLIYFIRVVASPKIDILIKQYREAYEKFMCPLCEYPIRKGPMKYLYWTRKTLKKLSIPSGRYEETEYNCPSCGTSLYYSCESCKTIRHSLLPFCVGCNSEKEILTKQ